MEIPHYNNSKLILEFENLPIPLPGKIMVAPDFYSFKIISVSLQTTYF